MHVVRDIAKPICRATGVSEAQKKEQELQRILLFYHHHLIVQLDYFSKMKLQLNGKFTFISYY
jgi:hypothetical protein